MITVNWSRTLHNRRGTALITAVLVVALVASVATEMAFRRQVDIRRSLHIFTDDRLYLFGLGVEAWAQGILVRDREKNQIDHEGEDWAKTLLPLTVEEVALSGRLYDLQGRFNLNNLLGKNQKIDPVAVANFKRLLSLLELDENLVSPLLDWLDSNSETRFPDGAEDDYYMGLETPYRVANRPMASVSELVMVKGYGYETYEKLAPYLSVLPRGSKLNINTASAALLASLAPDITLKEGESLIEDRGNDGFASLELFTQHSLWVGKKIDKGSLSVQSDYFLMIAEIAQEKSHLQLHSVLHRRGTTGVKTVSRSRWVD